MITKRFVIATSATICLISLLPAADASAAQVSNSVVTLGISGTRGSSIDSFKVLGVETIDVNDLGREIQASVFISYSAPSTTCAPTTATYENSTEAGDICGVASGVYAIGTAGASIAAGSYARDWNGRGTIPGVAIEGHHQVGPLSYAAFPQVSNLTYYIVSDQLNSTFLQNVPLGGGVTPVNFMPAIYFRGDVLSRLYGLSVDGQTWTEVTANTISSPTNTYVPSLYRFRAMAWMTSDLAWGVGLYGRSTLNQTCPTTYSMTLSSQAGQCPNYAAEKFPNATPGQVGGANNLSLLDQTLTYVAAQTYAIRESHLMVGNLATIQSVVNTVYNAGH
jgi:hypothetical protein